MARAHHDRRTPGDWLRGLFRQPPPGFYSRPAEMCIRDRDKAEQLGLSGRLLLLRQDLLKLDLYGTIRAAVSTFDTCLLYTSRCV